MSCSIRSLLLERRMASSDWTGGGRVPPPPAPVPCGWAKRLEDVLVDRHALDVFKAWLTHNSLPQSLELHFAIVAHKKMCAERNKRAAELASRIYAKYISLRTGNCSFIPGRVRQEIGARVKSPHAPSHDVAAFAAASPYLASYLNRQHDMFLRSEEFIDLFNEASYSMGGGASGDFFQSHSQVHHAHQQQGMPPFPGFPANASGHRHDGGTTPGRGAQTSRKWDHASSMSSAASSSSGGGGAGGPRRNHHLPPPQQQQAQAQLHHQTRTNRYPSPGQAGMPEPANSSLLTAEVLMRSQQDREHTLGESALERMYPPSSSRHHPYVCRATTSQKDSAVSSSFSSDAHRQEQDGQHRLTAIREEHIKANHHTFTIPKNDPVSHGTKVFDHDTPEGRERFADHLHKKLMKVRAARIRDITTRQQLRALIEQKSLVARNVDGPPSRREEEEEGEAASSGEEETGGVTGAGGAGGGEEEEEDDLEDYLERMPAESAISADNSRGGSGRGRSPRAGVQSPKPPPPPLLSSCGQAGPAAAATSFFSASPSPAPFPNLLPPPPPLPAHHNSHYNSFAPPPSAAALHQQQQQQHLSSTPFMTSSSSAAYARQQPLLKEATTNHHRSGISGKEWAEAGVATMSNSIYDSSGIESLAPSDEPRRKSLPAAPGICEARKGKRSSNADRPTPLGARHFPGSKLLTISYKGSDGVPVVAHVPATCNGTISLKEFRKHFAIANNHAVQFYFKTACVDDEDGAPYQLELYDDDAALLPLYNGRIAAEVKKREVD